jgi:iron(III) transport system ATP-binding protein
MRNAEIAQAGTPAELYMLSASVFVATFMGEANHIPGRVEAVTGEVARVALDTLRIELRHRGPPPGEAVGVSLDPEGVVLVRP